MIYINDVAQFGLVACKHQIYLKRPERLCPFELILFALRG